MGLQIVTRSVSDPHDGYANEKGENRPARHEIEREHARARADGPDVQEARTYQARRDDAVPTLGVVTAAGLWQAEPGSRVLVGGLVTHRQRPMTAQGTTFMNLEDETGLMNVVISKGCWARHRRVAREAPALLVRGRLERSEGVINIVAEAMDLLPVPASTASRDFR